MTKPVHYKLVFHDVGMRLRQENLPAKVTIGGKEGYLPRLNGDSEVLISFNANHLHFNETSFCPGVRLFLGAEWHAVMPLWQFPHQTGPKGRWDHDRYEVWGLTRYKSELLLVDDVSAMRKLSLDQGGQPILRRPSPKEIVTYLCVRGDKAIVGKFVPSLQWVIDSLKTMQTAFPELRPQTNIEQEIARFTSSLRQLPKKK